MLSATQIEKRRSGLGSSEIAAVAGENPYSGPHDVWLVKRGLRDESGDGRTWIGTILEPAIAARYAAETGRRVRKFGRTVRSRSHGFALASPDYGCVDEERLVECKSVGWRVEHHWSRRVEDGVPPYVLLQAQWQMGVTGIHRCDVVVVFLSDGDLKIYELVFDEKIFSFLLAIGERFWAKVKAGELVPPDASEACREALKALYSRNRAPLKPAPEAAAQWVERKLDADARAKAAEEESDLAGNHLRALIADAEGIQGEWGCATWKADSKGRRQLRVFPRKDQAA